MKKTADKLLPKIIFNNKPEDEMIIGAYVEPLVFGKYKKEYNVQIDAKEAYDDLKAANFNTLLQCMSQLNKDDNAYTLEMFEQTSRVKMNFLFRDHEIVGDNNIVTEKTDAELKEYFKKVYMPLAEKYSSFAGMHYIDEPGYKDWKRAKEIKNAFKSVFPDKLFFLNLLQVYAPHWAFPNGPCYMPEQKWWLPDDPDYIKYYESYIKEAEPEMFCYDYYPVRYEFPYLFDQYFLQLHLGYIYSKKSNLPLLCFIQNGVWDTTGRIPNEDELRWQINTALAYNTKGLCWYTYWVPEPFHKKMCVHEYGIKTSHYYLAQKINAELLFQDEFILNFAFVGYILYGKTPNGEILAETEKISRFGKIKGFTEGNLFIGCFVYHKDGKEYNAYIIVNNTIKDFYNGKLTFTDNLTFTKIYRDKKESLTDEHTELRLTPGDACIIIEDLK